jgi:hypothetical protein
MTLARLTPWLIGALLTSCLALWVTADASSGDVVVTLDLEARAFDRLAAIAAAHGHAIPDGLATYAQRGDAAIAHAPLDGIAGYTAADFETGVLIMAVVIDEPTAGRVPSGAYVVQVKRDPGSQTGVATYFDAQGRAAAQVSAQWRTLDALLARVPASAPRPAKDVDPPRSYVWSGDHHAIACAGWQPYQVVEL